MFSANEVCKSHLGEEGRRPGQVMTAIRGFGTLLKGTVRGGPAELTSTPTAARPSARPPWPMDPIDPTDLMDCFDLANPGKPSRQGR